MKTCIWRAIEFGIFIILLLVPSCISQGRRYDIEEEALKLFHEDLRSVVARFRRSPEYLKIMRDKVNDMFRDLEIKETYLFLAQKEVIEKRVKEVLSMDNSTASVDCVTEETVAMTGEGATQGRFFRRTHETTTQPGLGVSLLDGYSKFSDRIQVADRNKLRDIGFEEAGNLIHQIKKVMMSDEPETSTAGEKPTALAGAATVEGEVSVDAAAQEGEETTHVYVHTVTTEEATTLLPPAPEEIDDQALPADQVPPPEQAPPEEMPPPANEATPPENDPQKLRNQKTTKGKGNQGKTTQGKKTQGKTTQVKKKGRREFTLEMKTPQFAYLPTRQYPS